MAEMAVRNILAVLNGEEPVTPVNQKVLVTKKRNLPDSEGFLIFLYSLLDGLCLMN